MKKNRATAIDILLLTGAILLLFYAVFHFKYRVEYDKLAGDNIWQSASTIKYADMWLEEGPDALHFTAYENFPSIEFASLEDRTPFISYPSEHTLLVYLAARAAGRTEIDISFLKHFQLLLFALEALVLGLFLYIFMLDIGYRSRAGRIVFAAAGAILWTLFPVNTYYLANIFFTDQSVIFWLFWFILTDYMIHRKGSRTALRRLLTLPLWLVIICGMLTDYFFWILVFFVAVFRWLGRWVITQNWRNGLPEFFLRYSFPVAISLVLFFWQLSYTPNWLRTLLYKLEHRSGGFDNTESVFARLLENLTSGFFSSQRSVLLYYVFLLMITLVGTGIYLHRHHAGGLLFANNAAALFGASYLAIVVHTLLLKNHAAVHEFSMVKVSWIIMASTAE